MLNEAPDSTLIRSAMKSNALNKRLAALEENAKPRIIATLADFVLWCSEEDHDENVELSPQMQEFVEDALKLGKTSQDNTKRHDVARRRFLT